MTRGFRSRLMRRLMGASDPCGWVLDDEAWRAHAEEREDADA